jgi:amino acid transporter
VREAFGPLPGYVVGWMCFANSVFAFAAVAHIAAAYVLRVGGVPQSEPVLRAVGAGVVILFCALNALGAKPGARVAVAFTLAKLLALVTLVVAAVPAIVPARWSTPLPHGLHGVGEAVFLALFAAQGFEVTPVPAGETHQARQAMPFATLASLIGASILYVIVQAVVVGAHAGLARPSETPLAEAALAVAPRLGLVVIWGGVVSTLGFVAGNAFGTPRYAYAMAQDGYLPRALAFVDPRRGAPLGAIAATAIVSVVLTLSFSDGPLFAISNLAVAVQYLGTCLAVGWGALRGGERRGRRFFFAVAGAAVSLWILGKGTAEERRVAFAALAAGALFGVGRYLTAGWPRRK